MRYTELRITRWKEATQVQMQSKCISRATVFQKFPDLIPLYRRSFTTLFLHCAKRPSSLPAANPPPPRHRWYPSLHYTRREDYCTVFRIGDLHVFKEKRETRSIFGFIFSWIPSRDNNYPLPVSRIANADFTEYHLLNNELVKIVREPGISSRFDT